MSPHNYLDMPDTKPIFGSISKNQKQVEPNNVTSNNGTAYGSSSNIAYQNNLPIIS